MTRRVLFLILCAISVAVAAGYAVLRRPSPHAASTGAEAGMPLAKTVTVLGDRPRLLFTSAAFDSTNGFLGIVPLSTDSPERYRTELRCDRVHFAKAVGICLSANRGVITTFAAQIFGPDFQVRQSLPLKGVPSRARVSPDGRRGAWTVFVSGDSYSSNSFSTRTTMVDMTTGQAIADLEEFAVTRDGKPFNAADFNFWGVTFAHDGNRFFATLGTGGTTYLIEGNVDMRSARTLREGVECPSLSPDNTRIAFKKRVSAAQWRLHVLDVSTLVDSELAETRSVDDQVEWLDNEQIAYMLPSTEGSGAAADIWSLEVDARSPSRILLRRGLSPVALNP